MHPAAVQVLQQEEQVDQNWAQSESAAPGGPRPRKLRQRWKEALEEAADGALPQRSEATTGQLDCYLERLRGRMVEDLGAAKRNVVNIYPEDFQPFQVSPVQSGPVLAGYSCDLRPVSPPPSGVPAELPPGRDLSPAGAQ